MNEVREILDAVADGRARGEAMALATIVGVEGSTYRREGARLLLVGASGMVGNISGGCLEGDVRVVADDVIERSVPRLMTYDLTADDDMVWGLGLGCNGKVDVFVEPILHDDLLIDSLRRAVDQEESIAIALVVRGTESVPAGSRLIVHGDAEEQGSIGDAGAADRIRRAARSVLSEGRSVRRAVPAAGGTLDVFIEAVRPPIRLVVCGAGHDAIPLVAQAVAVGWRVVVLDRREAMLTPTRFPGARFIAAPFAEAASRIPIDDWTYLIVMTHNYLHDKAALRSFLTASSSGDGPAAVPQRLPAYLGMLGPRVRTEKILNELAADGVHVPDTLRPRVYGPVGLDVGSEGPDEIAVAIIAEILAVDRGRPGAFLRDRRGSIHAAASW